MITSPGGWSAKRSVRSTLGAHKSSPIGVPQHRFFARTRSFIAFPWDVPITQRPDGAALLRYRYRTPYRQRGYADREIITASPRPTTAPGNSPVLSCKSPAKTNARPDIPQAFKGDGETRTETDDGHFNLPVKTRGKQRRSGARPFDETSTDDQTKFSGWVQQKHNITSTQRCRPTDQFVILFGVILFTKKTLPCVGISIVIYDIVLHDVKWYVLEIYL